MQVIPCKYFSQALSAAARLPPVAVATPTHALGALEIHLAEYTLLTMTITTVINNY